MIKWSIHQDRTVINIYALNIRAPKYTKQILKDLKGEIDNNTIIVGDLNTPLSAMDRSSRWKINKEKLDLNHTLDQIDLTDTYRTFQPTVAKNTFFSSVHRKFSRIGHMIGYKTSLCKFKKTEIITSIFSYHNGMKLEINKRKAGKFTNMWKLNNTRLNNRWVKEETKREILKISKSIITETVLITVAPNQMIIQMQ